MITQIDISSFRSIKKQEIPIKKFNILYGPNGSGKSSVMYAAYVIRNFFVNPGQQLNRLFNLGFINLGGFDNVIYNKDYRPITISITSDKNFIGSDKILCKLTVVIEDFLNSEISYNIDEFEATLSIDFPFTAVEKKK
ncbi:MAG: AAA family ATPase [Segetibacter sp.]